MKIRSDILRVYQAVHTWGGICAGMLLFIGFFGGALTMFKAPLERWVSAPVVPVQALAPAQVDKVVAGVLAQYPAAREEFTLHVARDEHTPAPVSWQAGESGHEVDFGLVRWQATLDADGRLAVTQQQPSLLAELIDMLHRTGGIPGTLGEEYLGIYVMGVAGLLYFLALVSGVILLLPTLVKDFFALRPGKNRKRFWLDAHNILGITSLPFHIVISITVVVFAFHDQFYDGLRGIVYRDQPMFSPPAIGATPRDATKLLPASELVRRVQQQAPGFEVTELLYMGVESPRPIVRAAVASPRHLVQAAETGFVIVQPYSGAILSTSMLPGQGNTWSALVAPFFALHFGSYGGMTVRWLYFAFGLAGAALFYTGNLLWIEKRRKNQLKNGPLPAQPRRTLHIAAATVGVCLGSVAGIGACLVAAKWLHAFGAHANSAYLTVYYTVFLACVAWAFVRGAARAGSELLGACALAAAAIPATSLAAAFMPALGMWTHTSPATLGVDGTALLLAAAFAWAATRAARRARNGAADSVWSAAAAPAVVAPEPARQVGT
ncbi:PepSY-associated TM helix domain-containing protein [Pseudoduganella chitinolytica]|uniref:PepSY-associated TM helix domain-containing protein n=1 Tax=Pseudoduganella chitinolytica TaxID=34070 RepID=A0ABY8BGB7_9BURK|nr:PepSY-associated TM helix domain-containing protein [Pseudoduganella chitinolytica]WEF34962.1 PepSY-associated TM helix domain-containing protein [Pseudoduganella chitinolytica]